MFVCIHLFGVIAYNVTSSLGWLASINLQAAFLSLYSYFAGIIISGVSGVQRAVFTDEPLSRVLPKATLYGSCASNRLVMRVNLTRKKQ